MSASEAGFKEAVETGAVSLVTSLAQDSSDVLLQLNALDLLEQVMWWRREHTMRAEHETGSLSSLVRVSIEGCVNHVSSEVANFRAVGLVLAGCALFWPVPEMGLLPAHSIANVHEARFRQGGMSLFLWSMTPSRRCPLILKRFTGRQREASNLLFAGVLLP